jgi:hypothetical protein
MENGVKTKKVRIVTKNNAGSSAIYSLGMIGAIIYFIQNATGFVGILIAIAKGIFWPAVMVYKVLEILYR